MPLRCLCCCLEGRQKQNRHIKKDKALNDTLVQLSTIKAGTINVENSGEVDKGLLVDSESDIHVSVHNISRHSSQGDTDVINNSGSSAQDNLFVNKCSDKKPSHRDIYMCDKVNTNNTTQDNLYVNNSSNKKPSYRDIYMSDKVNTKNTKHSTQDNALFEKSSDKKPSHRGIYMLDIVSTNHSTDDTLFEDKSTDNKPSHRDKYMVDQPNTASYTHSNLFAAHPSQHSYTPYKINSDTKSHVADSDHTTDSSRDLEIELSLHENRNSGSSFTNESNFIKDEKRVPASKPSHRDRYLFPSPYFTDNSVKPESSLYEHNPSDRYRYITPSTIHQDTGVPQSDIHSTVYPTKPFAPESPKPSHRDIYLNDQHLCEPDRSTPPGVVSIQPTLPLINTSEHHSDIVSSFISSSRTKKADMENAWKKPSDISNINVVRPQRINETESDYNSYQKGLYKINLSDVEEYYSGSAPDNYMNRNRAGVPLGDNFNVENFHNSGLPSASSARYTHSLLDSKEVEDGTKVFTLLQSACKGDLNTLKRHYHDGTDMSIADYDGRRALHLAAAEGNLECVKFLIETCNVPHSPRDRWFHTPLDEAKSFKQEAVCQYLEAYIQKVEEQERGAKTYLLLNSACKGDVKTLKRLFQDGVDMRIADYDGRTALHLSAAEGQLECVQFLIETCEVQHSPKDRWFHTPLDEAKNTKHDRVVAYLEDQISQAHDKNAGSEVYSILNSACKGDVEALKKMAHNGIDMETSDYDGRTALHLAAAEGHAEVVKFLVEKCKVATTPKDRWQHTPMDEAKNNKNDTVMKYLERYIQNKPSKIIQQ